MESTQRFSVRVENYVRYRPGYPREILKLLRERYGLTRDSEIADVGSGTGALAQMFLENGNRVCGVEPNAEMRRAGERLLAAFPRFTSVEATAEATTLPDRSADFVTAGQAFHWFDPGSAWREFGRILKPRGLVVLVWNARRKERTGFPGAYERLLETHGTDYAEVDHGRRGSAGKIRDFFAPMPVEEWTFGNAQRLDLAGLKGRVLSSSYVPAEGEPGCAEMLADLEDVFSRYQDGGAVIVRYDTQVYVGVLRADR